MSSNNLRRTSHLQPGEVNDPRKPDEKDANHHFQLGFGPMARHPIVSLLLFVAMGIGLGVGLSFWTDDDDSKAIAVTWIGLVGDLFLRALKAIVLPLVFVNVVIACVEMMMVGAAGGIGGRAIGLYLATTLIASVIGSCMAAIFSRWFHIYDSPDEPEHSTFVSLGCREENSFLMENTDGSVTCTADWTDNEDILWEVAGPDGAFVIADPETVEPVSLSQQFYEGIFLKLIPTNVFEAFVEANFAAIVVFAIAVGVAIAKLGNRLQTNPKDTTFMMFLMETDQILTIMIGWVITLTPFAVFSMIAASIGIVDDLGNAFANVGLLVACIFCGLILHYLFTYCGGMLLVARINPFSYLRCLVPAQLVAFATASSAATIPVNIESTVDGGVPETIAKFLVPLGATINMDGAAICYGQ